MPVAKEFAVDPVELLGITTYPDRTIAWTRVLPEDPTEILDRAMQQGILAKIGEHQYELTELGLTKAYEHGLRVGKTVLQAMVEDGIPPFLEKLMEGDGNGQA